MDISTILPKIKIVGFLFIIGVLQMNGQIAPILFDKSKPICSNVCYVKSKFQRFPKYTGKNKDTLTNKDIYAIHFSPSEERTIWTFVKKENSDENNYLSYMLCSKEISNIEDVEYFVRDTLKSKNFRWELFPADNLKLKEVHKEPRIVFCNFIKNPEIILLTQTLLNMEGFYEGEPNGTYDDELKKAFTNYQIENDLAIGDFTIEALLKLKVIQY